GELLLREHAGIGVRTRRGELHEHQRVDELRVMADRDPRDLEVLECARGLHAVVGVCRDLLLPEQILLDAGLRPHGAAHQDEREHQGGGHDRELRLHGNPHWMKVAPRTNATAVDTRVLTRPGSLKLWFTTNLP